MRNDKDSKGQAGVLVSDQTTAGAPAHLGSFAEGATRERIDTAFAPRTFAIEIACGGVDSLCDALKATPLSDDLQTRLWDELFSSPSLHGRKEGVTYWGDVTALGTGDHCAHVELGRAGKALVAAFRALAVRAGNEAGDVGHELLSGIEITPEMIERNAGTQALAVLADEIGDASEVFISARQCKRGAVFFLRELANHGWRVIPPAFDIPCSDTKGNFERR